MKAQLQKSRVFGRSAQSHSCCVIAAAFVVLAGCATQQPVGVVSSRAPTLAEAPPLEPGLIAVTSPHPPGRFSFDKAKGRIEYASDGAGNAARAFLEPPRLGDPAAEMLFGPVGFTLAPFGAAYGALTAGRRKLSPEDLSDSEADLAHAMALMAEQRHLRHYVLKAATEKSRRRFVPADSLAGANLMHRPVSAVLETQVEELRLERTGTSDISFALRIKTRARLLRTTDCAVLFDQPFEYRSDTALFLDWTYSSAFQGVAETAYRALAEQMVEQLFPQATEAPLFVGAGYKKAPDRVSGSPTLVAAHQTPSRPANQVVTYPGNGFGTVHVYATEGASQIYLQTPVTREQAVAEAINDTEWSLDGLQDSRNIVIQLGACVAAIPVSLWNQTVNGVRGVSSKQSAAVEAQLSAVARQTRPEHELACQIAQQLAPKTAQPVMLVQGSLPRAGGSGPGSIPVGACGTWVSHPHGHQAANGAFGPGADMALEIQVLSTALKGRDGVNPPLALCIEAQARLWRTSDGEEIHSCFVNYRSAKRKFTEWAAHNARPFRQELDQCYQKLSRAVVDRLVTQKLVVPGGERLPTLAVTSK